MHSLPEIVVTDNGSNFTSEDFEDFLKQNGINHIRTEPSSLQQTDWLREVCKHSKRD